MVSKYVVLCFGVKINGGRGSGNNAISLGWLRDSLDIRHCWRNTHRLGLLKGRGSLCLLPARCLGDKVAFVYTSYV